MNSYTLKFGQMPTNIIERKNVTKQIVDDFNLDFPTTNSYIITGVRGSGKTVMLTNISKEFENKNKWIVIDINPENDVLPQMVSGVYESKYYKKLSSKLSISFSFHGFGISIEGKEPISDIKTVLEKMLEEIHKDDIKILLTIDEVSNTKTIRSFIHDFQSLIRKDYQIYLIMTGLNENVDSLQNNKALTFLIRTPKIHLKSLDLGEISSNYKTNLDVDDETANKLAIASKGYAFAFQVIGLLYSKYKNINKIYDELDSYLSMYVYDKIWSSIPNGEKQILKCFINKETLATEDILNKLKINNKLFSVYRDRLIKRDILVSEKFGELSLTLPRFNNYIKKVLD